MKLTFIAFISNCCTIALLVFAKDLQQSSTGMRVVAVCAADLPNFTRSVDGNVWEAKEDVLLAVAWVLQNITSDWSGMASPSQAKSQASPSMAANQT